MNIVWVSVLLPGRSLEQTNDGLWEAFLTHLLAHETRVPLLFLTLDFPLL